MISVEVLMKNLRISLGKLFAVAAAKLVPDLPRLYAAVLNAWRAIKRRATRRVEAWGFSRTHELAGLAGAAADLETG